MAKTHIVPRADEMLQYVVSAFTNALDFVERQNLTDASKERIREALCRALERGASKGLFHD